MATVRLTGIRLVALDLDDTLYPERDFVFSGFRAVGQWLRQRRESPIDLEARMRELFEAGHRGDTFDRLLAAIGAANPGDLVPEMVAVYRSHVPQITLSPDAVVALQAWRGRFSLVLISDGHLEVQRRKVDALDLTDRMDHIILTDLWGQTFWKPHPRAFEEAERLSNASGLACVYLADNPTKDFLAPWKRGWRTIQVRREGGLYGDSPSSEAGKPDHLVRSLAEIELAP